MHLFTIRGPPLVVVCYDEQVRLFFFIHTVAKLKSSCEILEKCYWFQCPLKICIFRYERESKAHGGFTLS